jgi:hypothetical protein
MKRRSTSILLAALLIFSQLLGLVGLSRGLAWCHHPDGEIVVETASERADCHAAQAQASGDDSLKNCVDVPLGDGKPSQPSRTDSSRELAALHAAALIPVLPAFGIDLHLIASKLAVRPLSDDDDPSRDVVLDSLSTVIILT